MSTTALEERTYEEFVELLEEIVEEIDLPENFSVRVEQDDRPEGRWYFQIVCWRRDVITGEMGWGSGGKGYVSEYSSKSELVQKVFGLYLAYVEHEARETFLYRGRRVFGPHMNVDEVWKVANKVDVRSAKHVSDRA